MGGQAEKVYIFLGGVLRFCEGSITLLLTYLRGVVVNRFRTSSVCCPCVAQCAVRAAGCRRSGLPVCNSFRRGGDAAIRMSPTNLSMYLDRTTCPSASGRSLRGCQVATADGTRLVLAAKRSSMPCGAPRALFRVDAQRKALNVRATPPLGRSP